MIPKKYRIKKEEFNQIFKNSYSIHSNSFTLLISNTPSDKLQIAVIPGSKFKVIVTRAKAKRRLSRAVQPYIKNLKIGKYVFICKENVLKGNFKELSEEVKNKLNQADFFRTKS